MKGLLILILAVCSGCSKYDSYAEVEKAKYLFMAARENAISWLYLGVSAFVIACCVAGLLLFVLFFISYIDNQKRRQMLDTLAFQNKLMKLAEQNMPEKKRCKRVKSDNQWEVVA